MTLEFRPVPQREEPSASDYARQWGESLNNLGNTFARLGQVNRQNQNEDLQRKIQMLGVRDEYGTEGIEKLFGPRPQPLKMFQREGQVQPLPGVNPEFDRQRAMASGIGAEPLPGPGQEGFDEPAYRNRYGARRLNMFLESEKRKRDAEAFALDKRKTEAEIEKALSEAYKNRHSGGLTPEQEMRWEDRRIKRQEAEDALAVPGYKRGNVRPRPEEAEKLRKSVAEYDKFARNISLLQQLLNSNGTVEMFGADAADMASTTEDVRLNAKNLYELGVLNGRDYELISNIIPPTKGVSALFTLDSTRKQQYSSALRHMKSGLEAKMKSLDYSPSSGEDNAGPQPGDVEDGFQFIGGDPSDPNSWRPQ